jgi:hypothetical protein
MSAQENKEIALSLFEAFAPSGELRPLGGIAR